MDENQAVYEENFTIHEKRAVLHQGYAYIFDAHLAQEKKRWKCVNSHACKAYLWIICGLLCVTIYIFFIQVRLGAFPPSKWSVHTRTLLDQDRTNNKVEGWHKKIKDFLGAAHPEIYVFLDELKNFFRQEEDRRRQNRATTLQVAAAAAIKGTPSSPTGTSPRPLPGNFYKRRSAELKAKVLQFQNGDFQTTPVRTGLIRFLSEVADILMRRPPRGI